MTDITSDNAAPEFTVLGGNPTPSELAAVAAVLTAAIQEETAAGTQTVPVSRSAWQLAQRPIRRPIDRGISAWRNFSG